MPILTDEQYADLDVWMEYARMLRKRVPELEEHLMQATWPIFRDFYQERGIDPAGNPIKGAK